MWRERRSQRGNFGSAQASAEFSPKAQPMCSPMGWRYEALSRELSGTALPSSPQAAFCEGGPFPSPSSSSFLPTSFGHFHNPGKAPLDPYLMQRAGKKAAASAQRRKKDFPAAGYTSLLLLFRLLFRPSGLRYAVDLLHEGKCSPFSIRAFHINDIPLHDLLYFCATSRTKNC